MTHLLLDSFEAMGEFTGNDPAKIYHPGRDAEFPIQPPKGVLILNQCSSFTNRTVS